MQPLGKVPCRPSKLRKWHPKASIQTLRKVRGKKIRLYLTYRYGRLNAQQPEELIPTRGCARTLFQSKARANALR